MDSPSSVLTALRGLGPESVPGVVELLTDAVQVETADHYSKQWSAEEGFGTFMQQNPEAAALTPGKQLGWPALIDRIRVEARERIVHVFDAACGFGGVFQDLFAAPVPAGLRYVGADIHARLGDIARPPGVTSNVALFLRWNISRPLPARVFFDYVICRAAIHHTPVPASTFAALAGMLAPNGVVAISAYARKTPMREAVDDALRTLIGPLDPDAAFLQAAEFTKLGRDLQAVDAHITISDDLPLLGIRKGSYPVQAFLYEHFIKCWYNEKFGERYSDLVNFDWYHPEYAWRHSLDELRAWFDTAGLTVEVTRSIPAQHYLEGRRA